MSIGYSENQITLAHKRTDVAMETRHPDGIHTETQDMRNPKTRGAFYVRAGKRIFDCLLIAFAAPVVVPLIVLLAVLSALDGIKPFYWQERVGRDGKIFKLLKIRTMVPNAEKVLDAYLADNPKARAEWDVRQKLQCDPRVTRFGAAIRKTSLDELPQLWNVMMGDMSLVGPRPMMVEQRSLYPGEDYYRLRPGITGLWQISERNDSSFAERAIYDTQYYRNLSMRADISILWRTIGVVLRATGY